MNPDDFDHLDADLLEPFDPAVLDLLDDHLDADLLERLVDDILDPELLTRIEADIDAGLAALLANDVIAPFLAADVVDEKRTQGERTSGDAGNLQAGG